MTITKFSIYLLEHFVSILCAVYFIESTIPHKYSQLKRFSSYAILIILSLFIVFLSMYNFLTPIHRIFIIISLFYLLVNYLSDECSKKNLFIVFTPFLIQLFLIFSSSLLLSFTSNQLTFEAFFNTYFSNHNIFNIYALQTLQLTNTLIFPLHLFVLSLVNKNNKKNISFLLKIFFIANICYANLAFIIFYLLNNSYNIDDIINFNLIINVFTYVINFGIFFSTKSFNESNEKIMQYEIETLKQNFQSKHYEIAQKNNEEATKKYHDIKNQLNIVYKMLKKDKDTSLNILNSIDESLSTILPLNFCNNELINIIFADKIEAINSLDINLEINLHNIEQLKIQDLHVINIFTNLLDNATKACAKIENERFIHISSTIDKSFFIIKVNNSYNPELEQRKNGQGLKILEDLCKHYNGYLYLNKNNSTFETKLILDYSLF